MKNKKGKVGMNQNAFTSAFSGLLFDAKKIRKKVNIKN